MRTRLMTVVFLIGVLSCSLAAADPDLGFDITLVDPDHVQYNVPFRVEWRIDNYSGEPAVGYIYLTYWVIMPGECTLEEPYWEVENDSDYFQVNIPPGGYIEGHEHCVIQYSQPPPGEKQLLGNYFASDWIDPNPSNDLDCDSIWIVTDTCDPGPQMSQPNHGDIYEVYPGETVDISAYAKNNSTDCMAPENYMAFSFPFFTGPNDDQFVDRRHWPSHFEYNEYPAGSTIYDRNCEQMTAQYLLAEFSTDDWPPGQEYDVRIRVTPPETLGDYPVLIRTTMGSWWWDCLYYNSEPPGRPLDQQGWECGEITIRVVPRDLPDSQVVSSNCDPGYFRYHQSTPMWAVVGVRSPSGSNVDLKLFDDEGFSDLLASSTTNEKVDFVVGDYNHNPTPQYDYPYVWFQSGSGTYQIEYEDGTDTLDPYPEAYDYGTWASGEVTRAWDVVVRDTTDAAIRFWITPLDDMDFGLAVFKSTGDTYYAGKEQAWHSVDTAGPGEAELLRFTYSQTTDDVWSLVAWCNNVASGDYIVGTTADVPDLASSVLPSSYALWDPHPNPFNSATVITYELPKASEVKLEICNLLGEKVTTLINEKQQPGYYSAIWDGSGFSSGIYFCKLTAGEYTETKRMTLVK